MRDILKFGLIGAAGGRYMFNSPGCPVRLGTTPKGLRGAPFESSYQQGSRQAGETFKSRRYKRSPVILDAILGLRGVSGPRARQIEEQWHADLGDTETTCRFVVVSSESGFRWKDCRKQDVVDPVDWAKPGLLGENREAVALASDDAFWSHRAQSRIFSKAQFGAASILNEGDQPAWLTWTLLGKADKWRIGVDGEVVEFPATPEGGSIRIHSDPEFPTATLRKPGAANEDLYERPNTDFTFYKPLPGGGTKSIPKQLTIQTVNASPDVQVLVEWQPKSRAAW